MCLSVLHLPMPLAYLLLFHHLLISLYQLAQDNLRYYDNKILVVHTPTHACMYACTHIHTHSHTHNTHARIHTHTQHTHKRIYKYTHIHRNMYVHAYTLTTTEKPT